MGLTSDSETDSIIIKPEINEITAQADVDRSDHITQNKNDNHNNVVDNNQDEGDNDNVQHSLKQNNSNFVHKCTFAGCDKSFDRQSRLTWHLHQHTGERPYKCNFKNCNKSYTIPSHLKRHQKSHELIDGVVMVISYRCGTCQLTFKNQFNLRRHYQRVHEKKNRLFCEECNFLFRNKNRYDGHLARYHNGKLLKCNQCDREYKNSNELQRHIKIHDIKYKCSHNNCNVICDTYKQLRKHSTTHPREYKCDKCKKNFSNTYRFNRHLKTHEDKLSVCPHDGCNKKYHHTNQLKIHIRTKHEKNKLFECDLCEKTFTYKSVLGKHIQSLHLNRKSIIFNRIKIRHDIGKEIQSTPSGSTGVFLPRKAKKIINRDTSVKLPDTNFEFVKVEQI